MDEIYFKADLVFLKWLRIVEWLKVDNGEGHKILNLNKMFLSLLQVYSPKPI